MGKKMVRAMKTGITTANGSLKTPDLPLIKGGIYPYIQAIYTPTFLDLFSTHNRNFISSICRDCDLRFDTKFPGKHSPVPAFITHRIFFRWV